MSPLVFRIFRYLKEKDTSRELQDLIYIIKTEKTRDINIISDLLCLISDELGDDDIYRLIEILDLFAEPEYTLCFLENIHEICVNTMYWASDLLIRIINKEESLNVLIRHIEYGKSLVELGIIDFILENSSNYDLSQINFLKHLKKMFLEHE